MAGIVERLEQKGDDTSKEAADMIRRLLKIVKHAYPEQTGSFFICGSGPVADDGLPDRISVCPAFGAGWAGVYARTGKGIVPEW